MVLIILDEIPEKLEKFQMEIGSDKLTIRFRENSWSAVEVLAHLHACADIWGNSVQKMMVLDDPTINDRSPGKWERLAEYSSITFQDSLTDFRAQRQRLLTDLGELTLVDWSRSGWIKERRHTIFSQCRRMALHEQEHLKQFNEIIDNSK